MRKFMSKTLNSELQREVRECVSPLMLNIKDRKFRIVMMRCLFTNPEYVNRLKEVRRFAKREAKVLGYTRRHTAIFIAARLEAETGAVYTDMRSSFVHLLALVKFNEYVDPLTIDLGALRKHVYQQNSLNV